MPRKAKHHPGFRKGKLTVLYRSGTVGQAPLWRCRCDCGKVKDINSNVLRGKTVSCGCVKAEGNRLAHGMGRRGVARTRVYVIWSGMRQRCGSPDSASYANYGGRGIRVCERWNDFQNFYADMGNPPSDDHSLDRIDVNGGYEPENCRWATLVEQAANKQHGLDLDAVRFIRANPHITLRECAERFGVTQSNASQVRTGKTWKHVT